MSTKNTYFKIVMFGSPSFGTKKSYYRSLDAAKRDAVNLGGGSLSGVRVVEGTLAEITATCIAGGPASVVWHR